MRHLTEFAIEVAPARERVVLAVTGELDLDTTARLREALADVKARGFDHVVLDLRGVTFMDSTGLYLMIEEHDAAKANGHTFSLVYDDGPVRRLFELSGVEGRVSVVPLSADLGAEPRHAQTVAPGVIQGV